MLSICAGSVLAGDLRNDGVYFVKCGQSACVHKFNGVSLRKTRTDCARCAKGYTMRADK
ncbi:MAG: hypothetical protein LBP35_01875 [Candidatus Ancillula trichonymphae]|nr:hypothetical protein [Candidatus Ancillula trichonymphae]